MSNPYQYNAEILRVVDGDTLDLKIDVGFKMTIIQRCRLLFVNCPEMKGATYDEGLRSREFVKNLVSKFKHVVVRTHKSDSFGRYLAEIIGTDDDGKDYNIGEELTKNGHAIEFMRK